ncbi:hypothetical protein MLD38_019789 [Melastoma candidum]|uniref:Uncharacterized protein n=1 Tax=Melastoma candidum TaxID=119954 RepID=A0ACB9R6F6_9MYRT|nr:hypothetical protein MLD38_019789 [Melastoma candidum]
MILSWNVRGLNDSLHIKEVGKLVSLYNICIVGLFETKLKSTVEEANHKLFRQKWSYVTTYDNNGVGRMKVCWGNKRCKLLVFWSGSQWVHTKVELLGEPKTFFLAFVYGSTEPIERLQLWNALLAIGQPMEPWCILGDFNDIRKPEERVGGERDGGRRIMFSIAFCVHWDLKVELKKLNQEHLQDISMRVEQARVELQTLQIESLNGRPDWEWKKLAMDKFNQIARMEESFSKQKVRATWLKLGDRNTSYLHGEVNRRANINAITSLQSDNGERIAEQSRIQEEVVRHFEQTLNRKEVGCQDLQRISETLNAKIKPECQAQLIREVTNQEIKEAIFSSAPTGEETEFYKELVELLVPSDYPGEGMDKLIWLSNSGGHFSIKEAWELIRIKKQKVDWSTWIWGKATPPRCSFLVWLNAKGKLRTAQFWRLKGLWASTVCAFCQRAVETRDHLFFQCEFTYKAWRHLRDLLGYNFISTTWEDLEQLQSSIAGARGTARIANASVVMLYHIWIERSKRRATGAMSSAGSVDVQAYGMLGRQVLARVHLLNPRVRVRVGSRDLAKLKTRFVEKWDVGLATCYRARGPKLSMEGLIQFGVMACKDGRTLAAWFTGSSLRSMDEDPKAVGKAAKLDEYAGALAEDRFHLDDHKARVMARKEWRVMLDDEYRGRYCPRPKPLDRKQARLRQRQLRELVKANEEFLKPNLLQVQFNREDVSPLPDGTESSPREDYYRHVHFNRELFPPKVDQQAQFNREDFPINQPVYVATALGGTSQQPKMNKPVWRVKFMLDEDRHQTRGPPVATMEVATQTERQQLAKEEAEVKLRELLEEIFQRIDTSGCQTALDHFELEALCPGWLYLAHKL